MARSMPPKAVLQRLPGASAHTRARWSPGLALLSCAVALAADGCGGDHPARSALPPVEPDLVCLRSLGEQHISYRTTDPVGDVRTPVEPQGPVNGIRLTARAGRPPIMDCELLRALDEAAPVLRRAGIDELSFSGAYDYRTRHGSTRLSQHAFGLAIDVHVFRGPGGELNVARDFEKGAGAWRGLVTRNGDLAGCIGTPRTSKGRRLRRLVCELKHHSAFRVIVTPDDDADHRDHIHLEAFPDAEARIARVMGTFQ